MEHNTIITESKQPSPFTQPGFEHFSGLPDAGFSDGFGVMFVALCKSGYVHMARNCAVSLRACGYEGKIAIITDDAAMKTVRTKPPTMRCLDFFDEVIIKNGLYKDRTEMGKMKLTLYDLSPFEQTFFIDADSICGRKFNLEKVYEKLKHREFFMQITGNGDHWSLHNEIADFLGLRPNQLYDTHSGAMFWKRGPLAESIFSDSLKVYNELVMRGKKGMSFFNGIADEACFSGGIAGKYEIDEFDKAGIVSFDVKDLTAYHKSELIFGWASGANIVGNPAEKCYRTFSQTACNELRHRTGEVANHYYDYINKAQMQ